MTPFTDSDVILLCVKSQHTLQCLGELKRAGAPRDLPIVCCQNSIWNEPTCARAFQRVYGMLTFVPAIYLQPGEVVNPSTMRYGLLDIGLFPGGIDPLTEQISTDFAAAGFAASAHAAVMLAKGAKCLGNLGNVVRALVSDENEGEKLINKMRQEAMTLWQACGIEWEDYDHFRQRLQAYPGQFKIPAGYEDMKMLGSSWQSLERQAGSIETELLNGEVVALGKWVGIETPYNQIVTQLATQAVEQQQSPGQYTEAEILAMV